MIICTPLSTCSKSVFRLSVRVSRQLSGNICHMVSQVPSCSCCMRPTHVEMNFDGLSNSQLSSYSSSGFQRSCFGSGLSKKSANCHSLIVKGTSRGPQSRCLEISFSCQNLNTRFLVPKERMHKKIKCSVGPISSPKGFIASGFLFGLLVCYSSSEPVHAEASKEDAAEWEDGCDQSYIKFSHGKKVYTNYSVIGIPGDGRCLFRSLAHGACLRTGKTAPTETIQRELADELRTRVADEFIKRRKETEWFVEGDFNTYVSQMRKPHVWGGEPEMLMASHVLQMPITVYMYDKDAGGLLSIAEYGQEYGKKNPIRVLYHGFGHYDALQIPGNMGARSIF